MNVKTFDVPYNEARAALAEYKRDCRDECDEAIMKAYSAIVRGKRVIDVRAEIIRAGFDAEGRPRLALCRAHCERIWMRRERSGKAIHFAEERNWWANRHRGRRVISGVPNPNDAVEGTAVVPTIPPRFRPRGHLKNYHILWEAEWEAVPVDPILLKIIAWPFAAVLAHWNLTELERAVLGLRM